jgi:phosphatidylglycerol:prolipoprotein diacylglycerol transferase
LKSEYFVWTDHSVLYNIKAFGLEIPLRYYGLLFMLSFVFGFYYMWRLYRAENKKVEQLDSLLNHMLIGTIVGARLGHCFFYDPAFFFSHPLEILYVWKGGLASHGGLIGILIGLYLFSRKHPDTPYLWIIDRLTVPSVFGAFLIRVGNFFNSEIIGVPTNVPWAIIFVNGDHSSVPDFTPRHPSMLYEAACYLFIFVILYSITKLMKEKLLPGLCLGLLLVLVFTARFIVEFTKTKQESFDLGSLNMGHFLSIPFILVGVYFIIRAFRKTSVGNVTQ